jgi:hypothetical protein
MSFIKTILLGLVLSLTTALSAEERCDVKFFKVSVCANIDWVYGPFLDQYNSLKISLTENDKASSVKIIPWMVMSDVEHGSRPVVLTKIGDREFLIEKAYFMSGMDGQWFFKIQINDSKNMLIEEVRYLIEFKK